MNEPLESNTPEMDEETLGPIMDQLLAGSKPEVAEAIHLCAIPHAFDQEILAWLLGMRDDPQRTSAILNELEKLAFVHRRDHSYVCHESVRNLLLRRWREKEAERFRQLNALAADYFAHMLLRKRSSEKELAEWEREEMYHLLVADRQRGIERFISLADKAIDTYRLSTLDLLLSMAGKQADDPRDSLRLWIDFFEGKKDLVAGDWAKAQETWERLRGKREPVFTDLEKTLAVHLSILYKDKNEWKKAIDCFQDSLEILASAGDQPGAITLLNNRAFLYKDKEEWEKAENDLRRSLEISEKLDDQREMAQSLKNLGLLYKDRREWDKAIEYFQQSQQSFEATNDERGLATTYNDLGFLYKDKGEWEKAIDCFRESQKYLDKLGDEHGKAAVFNSLGFLYTEKQEWQNADDNFQRALQILEKTGDQRRMADTFSYLGILYRDKAEWNKADEYLQQGLEILEKMHDERGRAALFHNLGLLYKRKAEWERESILRRFIQSLRRLGPQDTEDWDKAVEYFQRSLKIVKEVNDKMNEATTMYELALLYEEMEQYTKSIELLEQVGEIVVSAGHPDPRIRRSGEILERVRAKAASSKGASSQ